VGDDRSKELILSVDIGTTNIKAALVSEGGSIVRLHREKLPLITADDGRAEHSPQVVYNCFTSIVRDLVKGYGSSVRALVISSYVSSVVLLDRGGRELSNLITWLDRRTVKTLETVKDSVDMYELYKRTGCPPLYMYPLMKLLWLQRDGPELLKHSGYVLDSKSYIIFKLINEPYIDLSTASATQLLNIHSLRWDDLALSIAGIDEGKLPKLVEGDVVLGNIPASKALEMGLGDDVVLVLSVYDGAAFIAGLGGLDEGVGSSHIGTSAMLRVPSGKPVIDHEGMELQSYYLCRGIWIPGGAIGNAGIVLEWLSSKVCRADVNELMNSLQAVKLTRNFPLSIPLLSPERFPKLTKCVGLLTYGLTLEDDLHKLAYSLLLGSLFLLRRFSDLIARHGINIREVRVGGGVAQSDLILKLLANVLKVPVLRPKELTDAGLIGNTVFALKALGYYNSLKKAYESLNLQFEGFTPSYGEVEVVEELYRRFVLLLNRYIELCSSW